MEESGQESTMNETSPEIGINNEKITTEKDKSSVCHVTADLCDLKEINCEIGANDKVSESCSSSTCNEGEQRTEKEDPSNASNESGESKEKTKKNENEDEQKDQRKSNESCALENNSQRSKQCSPSPSRSKDNPTCMKQKRKSRSTRRRLNAMINNTSLHFSDTDSEGELIIMEAQARAPSPAKSRQGPVISVTMEDIESVAKAETNPECLGISSTPEVNRSRRGSFAENLTDVDEIYTSEPENEQKAEARNSLTVSKTSYQGETDVEDLSNDEGEPEIYVTPRSDILCEFSGETITTKEGDGPFSVEIRNRMSTESKMAEAGAGQSSPDIVIMPNTDSEDMEMSDEEDLQVASCSQRDLFDDLDGLGASQIVMTNVNKTDNMLGVKDTQEDVSIGDCHTDVEDVEDVDCAE